MSLENVLKTTTVMSSFFQIFHSNLEPNHQIETVAVRMCAKCEIASTTKSEDREV